MACFARRAMVECLASCKRQKPAIGVLRMGSLLLVLLCSLSVQPCFAQGATCNFSPRRYLLQEKLSSNDIDDRIVGGGPADVGRYPYIVSLRDPLFFEHRCGAVLIDPNIVLTAAHCVIDEPNPLIVIGATLRDFEKDKNAEVRYACKTIRHHQFASTQDGYDIALIMLNETSTKKPIGSLDVGSKKDREGLRMTAIGWGKLGGDKGFPTKLQEITSLEYMGNKACGRVFEDPIRETMLCAKGRNVDACKGDSGGPLIWKRPIGDKEEDVLMGLTSFGEKTCTGKFPGVYTRISELLKWIVDGGIPRLNIVDLGPPTMCKAFVDDPFDATAVPRAEEIMERITEDDVKGASVLISIATKFGTRGRKELSRATEMAIEQCEGLELSQAFKLATRDAKQNKEVSKMAKPFLSKLTKKGMICNSLPAPKAEEVLEKIADRQIVDAREDVVKLLKIGAEGRKVLREVQQATIDDCSVSTFHRVLTDAIELLGVDEDEWVDIFDSSVEAINACKAPPPSPPPKKVPPKKPPPKKLPPKKPLPPKEPLPKPEGPPDNILNANDIVERVKEDDKDGAVEGVLELIENGSDDEIGSILEEIIVLAVEEGLGPELGSVLIAASEGNQIVDDVLNPYWDKLNEQISIHDLADELLEGDIDETADMVAVVSSDKAEFPRLRSRKRVLVNATKLALDDARKSPRTVNKSMTRISDILILALEIEGADHKVINSAIDTVVDFEP